MDTLKVTLEDFIKTNKPMLDFGRNQNPGARCRCIRVDRSKMQKKVFGVGGEIQYIPSPASPKTFKVFWRMRSQT